MVGIVINIVESAVLPNMVPRSLIRMGHKVGPDKKVETDKGENNYYITATSHQ
jgi:hypothetical protein